LAPLAMRIRAPCRRQRCGLRFTLACRNQYSQENDGTRA
jgi:hypothetical protein